MLTVTLMTEWRDWPLWVESDTDVPISYSVDEIGEVLPLSPGLLKDIAEWDRSIQETYAPDDPASSGFKVPSDQERFIAEGRRLAQRIKQEVGQQVEVNYAADGSIPTETIL